LHLPTARYKLIIVLEVIILCGLETAPAYLYKNFNL